MGKINRYAMGYLFDGLGNVALIEKNRPDWQKGRLNAPGGKIEKGETPLEAMVREFREEAGAEVLSWRQFAELTGDGYRLYCFTSRHKAEIKTMTDEAVGWYPLDDLPANILPNARFLIPMADYKFAITAKIIHQNPEC
jgi:8-oxo-dGTP diphosphatase